MQPLTKYFRAILLLPSALVPQLKIFCILHKILYFKFTNLSVLLHLTLNEFSFLYTFSLDVILSIAGLHFHGPDPFNVSLDVGVEQTRCLHYLGSVLQALLLFPCMLRHTFAWATKATSWIVLRSGIHASILRKLIRQIRLKKLLELWEGNPSIAI